MRNANIASSVFTVDLKEPPFWQPNVRNIGQQQTAANSLYLRRLLPFQVINCAVFTGAISVCVILVRSFCSCYNTVIFLLLRKISNVTPIIPFCPFSQGIICVFTLLLQTGHGTCFVKRRHHQYKQQAQASSLLPIIIITWARIVVAFRGNCCLRFAAINRARVAVVVNALLASGQIPPSYSCSRRETMPGLPRSKTGGEEC